MFEIRIRQHGDNCSVQTRVVQWFPLSNPVQSFFLRATFCRMLLNNAVHSIILVQRRKLPHQTQYNTVPELLTTGETNPDGGTALSKTSLSLIICTR